MRRHTALVCFLVLPLLGLAAPATAAPVSSGGGVQFPSDVSLDDPRGDADGDRPSARCLALADVIGVRYRAPRNSDGLFVVSVRFARLARRGETGGPSQGFTMQLRNGGVGYEVFVSDRDARPVVLTAADDGRVRPERLELKRRPGRGGTLTIKFSVEFLSSRRFHVETFAFSNDYSRPRASAYDNTSRQIVEYVR